MTWFQSLRSFSVRSVELEAATGSKVSQTKKKFKSITTKEEVSEEKDLIPRNHHEKGIARGYKNSKTNGKFRRMINDNTRRQIVCLFFHSAESPLFRQVDFNGNTIGLFRFGEEKDCTFSFFLSLSAYLDRRWLFLRGGP